MKEIMEPRVVDATTEHRVQVLENKSVDSKSVLVRATRASSSSSSSPANSPQFYREKVVYLDDVEEVQSPLRPNINYQDRRMFKFKHSPSLPIQMPDQEGHSEESDSWEDHKSPVRKSQIGLGKRARRRSTFGDNRCTKSRPKVQSDDASSRSKMKPCCKVKECSLENPCYDHVSNEKNDVEDIVKKLLMKRAALVQPEKDDRTCSDNVAAVYDVFTYTAYEPRKSPETDDDSSSNNSSDDDDDDDDLLTYLQTMTMPPERPKLVQSEKVLRSNSCPSQHPNHVHPKLPDYDEIAAKFSALRQEYLLQKKDLSGT
ncbi:hypothetical protein SAY86_022760 [Trapa natans]|uniref:Uncharacterized protein n=1 Tax=Trapa natans TaxID=22666 RepID=A0AAN7M9M1_TRANT|nr:hypothetical protein SAY86_022760 [Trapa natans]